MLYIEKYKTVKKISMETIFLGGKEGLGDEAFVENKINPGIERILLRVSTDILHITDNKVRDCNSS